MCRTISVKTRVGPPLSSQKSAAVTAFLEEALAGGEVEVAALQSKARAIGLLTETQEIRDAKLFRAAKRELGIQSRRVGFGAKGQWLWGLKTPPDIKARHMAPLVLSGTGTEDAYAVNHSRPRPKAENDHRACSVQPDEVPSEWVNGLSLLETRSRPRDVPALFWDQFIRDCRGQRHDHSFS